MISINDKLIVLKDKFKEKFTEPTVVDDNFYKWSNNDKFLELHLVPADANKNKNEIVKYMGTYAITYPHIPDGYVIHCYSNCCKQLIRQTIFSFEPKFDEELCKKYEELISL